MGSRPAVIAAPRLLTMSDWHGWGQISSFKLLLLGNGSKKAFQEAGGMRGGWAHTGGAGAAGLALRMSR